MQKSILLVFSLLFASLTAVTAQSEGDYTYATFRGTRIINGHSVELLKEGELDLLISHRFGRLNGGLYELFGLDQATIRIGLEYGLHNRFNVGIGRSSLGKHLDGYLKAKLIQQKEEGFSPVTITAFGSVALNTLKSADPEIPVYFQDRLAYTGQLLISRKWGERLSTQLMPTIVHYNIVDNRADANDVISIGAAIKFQLNKNVALLAEYYHNLPGQLPADRQNALAIGFDINTGSHVFQLQFTNAQSMIEKSFIGETTGDWGNGDVHFGFNISRIFKLKGRRY